VYTAGWATMWESCCSLEICIFLLLPEGVCHLVFAHLFFSQRGARFISVFLLKQRLWVYFQRVYWLLFLALAT
jgi:hypothetical protein